ncbi:MBL fold metallo-hydrolase [Thermorudis peleae]|uniref:MBL fold metallo-hydrolase n=1 Tax=Thermorudis peleae TaxID=1382356 RepID=UPI0018CEBCEC|nr:MBL fold metallo-hydrolase [Thermorudis peleae]
MMAGQTLTVGPFQVTPLVDAEGGFFPLSVVFPHDTPRVAAFREAYPGSFADPETLYTFVRCYLVRTPTQLILVDGGIGPGPVPLFGNSRGQLLTALAAEGVTPNAIDLVYFTHLHPDHAGWAVGPDGRPTFPRARYVATRTDWETFQQPAVKEAMDALVAYLDQAVYPLARLGVLELVDGEAELAPGIRVWPTPGHTTGHASLLLQAEDTTAAILGDVYTHPAQVRHPDIAAAFDMDAATAQATRERVNAWAAETGAIVTVTHFPQPGGFGRIVREGEVFRWEPLPALR